ncbi:thiamine biosynthesis lipoprotein [Zobellia uliginosa]|uniref:FAD:protein FMN transferase n=1 Tax=Zobellia uliginosa TaxID=143224 RepID=A0ABY1KYT0_9FLAO|nr:FAD:protein FMN transferase [Zobellia uliginosa]SIS94846.1 thiamine biosynthesis lipoprotein [Zobellia uliginosa]
MNRLIVFLVGLQLISCGGPGGVVRNEASGAALGTSYNLIYLTPEKLDLQKQIDSVFDAINHSLSTYIPTSDISRINKGDSTLVVDQMFREVFNLSQEVYTSTKGYFDPTVGVLVNAWGFGPGKQMEMDSARVDSLLRYVGFNKVKLTERFTVQKSEPDIYFDFNAIAKGYSIDRLAKLMEMHGVENYLLEVGGELVAKGNNQIKGKPWVVGIEDPTIEDDRKLKATIELQDKALASSGNYRHFRKDPVSGVKYVHTIDPITGFTKNSNTLAATVLADNCAKADAYATSFMAMDLDEVLKLLAVRRELEAYIIFFDEKGEIHEFMTPGFEALLTKS